MKQLSLMFGIAFMLFGCANKMPPTIAYSPQENLLLSQVKGNVRAQLGKTVRWGGEIISVENEQNRTWIQILQKRLSGSGRPAATSASEGRFLVKADQFLDPAIYTEGRDITVYGEIEGEAERMVGKHPLKLPVVNVLEHHLWEEYDQLRDYYPYPYYNYYPYGFYRGYWRYGPYWW